jgi:hypothetical protein
MQVFEIELKGKRRPAWQRSIIVSDSGAIYAPAGVHDRRHPRRGHRRPYEIRRLITLVEDAPVYRTATDGTFKKYFKAELLSEYEIKDDDTINVKGDCMARPRYKYHKFPVKFGRIEGDFYCADHGLTTLVGGPTEVHGYFNTCFNNLTSLHGSPTEVRGNFDVSSNNLTSLDGSPQIIGGTYACSRSRSKIMNIEGLPESFTGGFWGDWHPDVPLLRLLRCEQIDLYEYEVHDILNKYCGANFSRSNILACQKELIDAGFEGNASW